MKEANAIYGALALRYTSFSVESCHSETNTPHHYFERLDRDNTKWIHLLKIKVPK